MSFQYNHHQVLEELNVRYSLEKILNKASDKIPLEIADEIRIHMDKFSTRLNLFIKRQLRYWHEPIEKLELPARAYNSLKRANILKIGEILKKPEKKLREVKGFRYGSKGFNQIKQALAKYGLTLRDEYK